MTHVFRTAMQESTCHERMSWVVIRGGTWMIVLVPQHGDKALAGWRRGIQMFWKMK